ncbi:MAG TPA: TSUP family transporter [Verrucomicrobiae bacterium]|nr:TSUP family transporter [Verrucomicrobiae bacterium]
MTAHWQLPLLFTTGLAAGFVDSIAGGGGLITLPVLLSLGLGPREALGTNKLQATFGSASAAVHYTAAKTVSVRECVRGFCFTLVGAAAGAITVQRVDPAFLRKAIPILLAAVAGYVLLKPKLGAQDVHPKMRRAPFEMIFGLGLGFYDGFFGPGTGTFWAVACVMGLGYNLTRATGYTKVMNFASNLSSLVLFLTGGRVDFIIGMVMGIGQLLGARIGSRMVIARGTRFIRPIFLAVVLGLTLKLLYDAW